MPTYVQQAAALLSCVKSEGQQAPGQGIIRDMALAFVHAYPSTWQGLLGANGKVVNPVTNKLTDIGTLDENGDFTPDDNAAKAKLYALHYKQQVRQYHKEILTQYRLNMSAIVAEDAGKTMEQRRARLLSDVETESKTELGDSTSDVET